jgi:DNA-directed RNA polymerase specialized sigma24 family protein
MEQNASRRTPAPAAAVRTERVLESYYGQLVAWGTLLTRGDVGQAQDVVHDFYLHLTLTKPDLSGVANLDGYLYKSLRHIYLSGLARSSREALQFTSIAEFDSVQFALAPNRSGDPLQRQYDLRKVCCYSVWRKAHTKGASYFILRFFHGYHHQEIADLACLPISAVYNKLRTFRAEVRSYLEEPGKLHFTSRDFSPTPAMHWSPLSSIDLFKELRQTILTARAGACLPEEELIALYGPERSNPISCSLLSHIVSCERCLKLIDQQMRRPTLKDREPLDGLDASAEDAGKGVAATTGTPRERLQRSVRRHRTEILDHRPRTLSIAVDGKIVASHDVQGQRNVLSARIERPEHASFVEVFSEQGIRLALLSIGDLPPEGPHGQSQRVDLNDDRWLDLCLSFDGLGLNSEVTYFDPALVPELIEEDSADAPPFRVLSRPEAPRSGDGNVLSWPGVSSLLAFAHRFLRPMVPSPVTAWSLVLACVFCVAGYVSFRSPKPVPALNAREVLNHSIQVEATTLTGQTEHQVLRYEEASLDGNIVKQGTIDLWKDGDGKRHMRRLYDTQHRLIAAEWKQRSGERGQYPKTEDVQPSNGGSELMAGNLWMQDLSPAAFNELNGGATQVRPTEDGYELTTAEPVVPQTQLVSATLVLDSHFHAIRETMRVRGGVDVHEVRLVQADYERRPSSSVPDAIFDPLDQGLRSMMDRHPVVPKGIASDVQLAELHIAVLYQLNNLRADTSEPIEVEQTFDGHIRVSGTVADDDRKEEILSRLTPLNDHQLLDVRLISPQDVMRSAKTRQAIAGAISTYDVGETEAPADAVLRGYFQARGFSGEPLDAAVQAFSREALGHAQRALQNASALSRLGSAFPATELRSISFSSQQQWSEMAAKHAAALEVELRDLHDQMARLSPSHQELPSANDIDAAIGDPPAFACAANQLLLKTQSLNRNVGSEFASGHQPDAPPTDIDSLVAATSKAIPLQEAVEVTGFAVRLNAAARTAQVNRQHSRSETQPPNRP